MSELGEGFQSEIPNFDARLYLVTLKLRGAVIWRIDKYLPSAAVKVSAIMKEKVSFSLMETGPLMGWSENGGRDGWRFF